MSHSLAVLPPLRSSVMLSVLATQNALSLTKTKPQTAASFVFKSNSRFMAPMIQSTVTSSRPWPDHRSKSSRLFSNGKPNSNLPVTSIACYTQEIRNILPSPIFQSLPDRTILLSPTKNQQVFISYRGEELGYNFVSHLTDAFERAVIKFYIDKNEQRGKDLKHIFSRIEESKIGLPIFSSRYSESKWCIDELVKMKKCVDDGKLIILPVFYKVEPSDVRKPTRESEFGRNFWKLVEESDKSDPIQEWRKALEGISNKMGLTLRDKSPEADFIKNIVKAVHTEIKDEEDGNI